MKDVLNTSQARLLWLHAQRLDESSPFDSGPQAVQRAVEHLGYVQIDTINVVERCHHHILFNRIPSYKKLDLHHAQSREKSVFEYWTHALSYVPARDFRFYMNAMKDFRAGPASWYRDVSRADLRKLLLRIREEGPLSIRDIDDDILVEKDHPWASRKPSKKALQLGFYVGDLVISERQGMLKKYELTERHFGWSEKPRAASEKEILAHLLDRALRSQSLVSLDSICHLNAKRKPAILKLIEARMKDGSLIEIEIQGAGKVRHWLSRVDRDLLPELTRQPLELCHILSPFDPVVIQRKRLKLFFDYDHRFEAYLPQEKRVFGYFALPVLIGDEFVAALDLKADRQNNQLLIQKWTWLSKGRRKELKNRIEDELERFEKFQLSR